MATQTRNTYMYRPECIRHTLVLGYADATASKFALSMAPGVYKLVMLITKTVDFSHACKVGLIKPFLDAAQTTVADTAFNLADADDTSTVTEHTVATGAGAQSKYYSVVGTFGGGLSNLATGPFAIPYGLQLTWTNATPATTGSVTVEIVASRMV